MNSRAFLSPWWRTSRAQSARQYFVEKYEIDPSRLDTVGMGESKPMTDGQDANAMRRNRRVELELVP